jgi:cell division protein FtsZ
MSFKFGTQNRVIVTPKIVVMGVGGAGCNAVNNMILSGLKGIYFIVANTDAQALTTSLCENRIQLGAAITSGLGAGSSPEIGKKAAEESLHEIEDYIKDANMLFIAAGMGGGTGTGATPVIAKLAKEKGILTVGVVTKPFHFEQHKRLEVADDGIMELDRYCDTLIVISNQKLFGIANEDTTFAEAFKIADNVLVSGVKCITNLITNPGIVNLDFADVKFVMSSLGRAIMGEGEASGENRAIKAAEAAITNPLLEHSSIVGASSILINITSGPDITLFEVSDIMQRVTKELGHGVISKFGSVIETGMEGVIRVSIVATGIKLDNSEEDEDSGGGGGAVNVNNNNSSGSGGGFKPTIPQRKHGNEAHVMASSQSQMAKVQPIPLGDRGKDPFSSRNTAEQQQHFRRENNHSPYSPPPPSNNRKEEYASKQNIQEDNIINYPSNLGKHQVTESQAEDIIFEDDDLNDSSGADGNYSFFIPKTAARLPKKSIEYEQAAKQASGGGGNSGLFSKIFKKN